MVMDITGDQPSRIADGVILWELLGYNGSLKSLLPLSYLGQSHFHTCMSSGPVELARYNGIGSCKKS